MQSFCHKLPKIELHAHLNGSLSASTLKQLGCTQEAITKYQQQDTNLEQVFDCFKIAHDATNSIENLYLATQEVIREFSKDNVVYLELRTTPRSDIEMTEDNYIESVVKAIENNSNGIIIVKLILSLNRTRSYESQMSTLSCIIKFKNRYPKIIKGVDLSGDPTKGSFFRDLFELARSNGLYTATHCSEIKNDRETKEILDFKPHRLGHGTFIDQHPENWLKYLSHKIPVECCLTSNVVCRTVKSYKEHHMQRWIKEDLPFSLATDDKGVFKTSLSEEYFQAATSFNLTRQDLWNISYKSIQYSFADETEKDSLRLLLEQWQTSNI